MTIRQYEQLHSKVKRQRILQWLNSITGWLVMGLVIVAISWGITIAIYS